MNLNFNCSIVYPYFILICVELESALNVQWIQIILSYDKCKFEFSSLCKDVTNVLIYFTW
jgi:hypothetical protein